MKSEPFKSEFKNCPLVYTSWGGRSLESQPNFKRLLEILEVDFDNLQRITQPTQFEKIILPDESFYTDINSKNSIGEYALKHPDNWTRSFTNEYRETIDRVRHFALKNRTPTSSKKIYYFHGRKQIGEERLAEYFKSKGYEIIRPQMLTFDEQLNLLINAESFASTLGSISHNSVFLRDNAEIILIPRFNGFTGHQRAIDQVNPSNTYYIDSTCSVFNFGHNAFCYIISEQLKKFFGDKFDGYDEEDFDTFLQYVKFYTDEGRKINKNEVRDYGAFFLDFIEQLNRRKDLIDSYNISFDFEKMRSICRYQTHVHKKGWGKWINEDQISNDINQLLDIQAIKINFPNHNVYYSVYYNDKEGWSEEVTNGEMAGITGKSKSIYGIRILFDEAGAKKFNILYRVHKFDGEWTAWAKNGEVIYSHEQKLNAIQIKLEEKNS